MKTNPVWENVWTEASSKYKCLCITKNTYWLLQNKHHWYRHASFLQKHCFFNFVKEWLLQTYCRINWKTVMIFWVLVLHRLVSRCHHFRETCCLHLQDWSYNATGQPTRKLTKGWVLCKYIPCCAKTFLCMKHMAGFGKWCLINYKFRHAYANRMLSWQKILTYSDKGLLLLVGEWSHQAICPL